MPYVDMNPFNGIESMFSANMKPSELWYFTNPFNGIERRPAGRFEIERYIMGIHSMELKDRSSGK